MNQQKHGQRAEQRVERYFYSRVTEPRLFFMRCVRYVLGGAGILGAVGVAIGVRLWYVAKKPRHKKTRLVFDIDETILHSRSPRNSMSELKSDCCTRFHEYWRRPYAHWVLRTLSRFNQVYLFTAGSATYAKEVQRVVFPDVDFVKAFSNESCYLNNVQGVKDLRLVAEHDKGSQEAGEVSTDNCLLIDNLPTNRVDNQPFLGVRSYYPKTCKFYRDKEMLRIFWRVIWLNILGLEPGDLG